MMDEFTYVAPELLVLEFDPPVKAKDGTLTRLELREPTSNEVWVSEQHLTDRNGSRAMRLYQRALVSKVGGIPVEVVDEMPIGAFSKAARHLQSFVQAGLPDANGDANDAPPSSLTITFAEPIAYGTASHASITLREPTLAQMSKAENMLGDMSAQRVRAYQEAVVATASGESPALIAFLPISVLNRAASYVLGFSNGGRSTGA
jgi:hypothetical protein